MDDSPYILHHLDNEDCTTQGSQPHSFNMPFTYTHTIATNNLSLQKCNPKIMGSLIIDSKCEPPQTLFLFF